MSRPYNIRKAIEQFEELRLKEGELHGRCGMVEAIDPCRAEVPELCSEKIKTGIKIVPKNNNNRAEV